MEYKSIRENLGHRRSTIEEVKELEEIKKKQSAIGELLLPIDEFIKKYKNQKGKIRICKKLEDYRFEILVFSKLQCFDSAYKKIDDMFKFIKENNVNVEFL